jgi:hypothetical protein
MRAQEAEREFIRRRRQLEGQVVGFQAMCAHAHQRAERMLRDQGVQHIEPVLEYASWLQRLLRKCKASIKNLKFSRFKLCHLTIDLKCLNFLILCRLAYKISSFA